MVEATKKMFTTFSVNGRTSRRDFWLGVLGSYLILFGVCFVVGFVMGLISGILGIESPIVLSSGIGALLGVAVSIFVILAEIRRLHDTGKSGWYLLMSLIPFVGSIIVLIFLCTAGNPNDNQYGSC